jgi:tetrahydromethanopterin S-methyltransferase subunit H
MAPTNCKQLDVVRNCLDDIKDCGFYLFNGAEDAMSIFPAEGAIFLQQGSCDEEENSCSMTDL